MTKQEWEAFVPEFPQVSEETKRIAEEQARETDAEYLRRLHQEQN